MLLRRRVPVQLRGVLPAGVSGEREALTELAQSLGVGLGLEPGVSVEAQGDIQAPGTVEIPGLVQGVWPAAQVQVETG